MELNRIENEAQPDVKLAMRVSATGLAVNVLLTVFKAAAGILANSGAMLSDAVHSASDVFSTFVVMAGVKISARSSDSEHQYGHERIECIAAILLAGVLFLTGLGIGVSGIKEIFAGGTSELEAPGALALIAAVASIVIKEWMYHYTKSAAVKVNSTALMASAWHHRSDAFSSIGSFAGILGARIGFPVLDPIASVVICFFIGKAAFDIFKDAVDKLVDRSCDEETAARMREVVLSQPGVVRVDELRTRLFGAKIYVDIEIAADGSKRLSETHAMAQNVHDEIERSFKNVKHCMVHVNPCEIIEDEKSA